MANKRMHRLETGPFTVRLRRTCKMMSLKTVGKAYDLFKDCPNTMKIGDTNAYRLKKELEEYLNI